LTKVFTTLSEIENFESICENELIADTLTLKMYRRKVDKLTIPIKFVRC